MEVVINDGTIQLGYNGVPWTFTTKPEDRYTFDASPCRRPILPYREESIEAAKQIAKQFSGTKIYVLYSGGLDSESVLQSFKLANIQVTPVCIKFEDNLNRHDLDYAFKYLRENGFDNVKLIEMNIRDWLKSSECRQISKECQSPELGYTHVFKTILEDLKDGIPIIAQDQPLVWRVDKPEKSEWIFHANERHYSIHKFFIKYGMHGIPSFFQWSIELHNSYMYNQQWMAMFNNMYAPMFWTTSQLKTEFYYNQLKLAPRKKFTGFEQILPEILDLNWDWMATLPTVWKRGCDWNVFEWFKHTNTRRFVE